ncbi:MAG: UDP-N-acetylmuramate--L-alanine ligase [Patescibacteria group bacterium]
MNILDYSSFYFVGIKGVAMTSLAQMLLDAGKLVRGSDVEQAFVTEKKLQDLAIKIDHFELPLPKDIDCVVYTAAHQGIDNPQVKWAITQGLPTFSQAEAIASLFNQKQGLAVCGVGGKSTVSAMITWVLTKIGQDPSFSVGVGNIPGLKKTGAWTNSQYCVAEADEYVIDPHAPQKNQPIIPRFSFLKPAVTVCTNLRYDHPDVYRNFAHTKQVFKKFFLQTGDYLVVNADDQELLQLAKETELKLVTFGENSQADFILTSYVSDEGLTKGSFSYQGQNYDLELTIPGKFNLLNALAAIATVTPLMPEALINHNLKAFKSTARRFENKGLINGVQCFDDYAHHPNEVKAAIKAINDWYPNKRKVFAFQSHTYSRTKQLFNDFINAFADTQQIVMIDIFSSAREKNDPTISSDLLCQKIKEKYPQIEAKNLKNIKNLASFFKSTLKPGDVFVTLGAGDIYEVYELL